MTETVISIMSDMIPRIIAVGFGNGGVVSITATLLGYAIGKALSLVDNK